MGDAGGPFIRRPPFVEWCRRMPALLNTLRAVVVAAAGRGTLPAGEEAIRLSLVLLRAVRRRTAYLEL